MVWINLRGRTPQQFAVMIADKLAALGITAPVPVAPSHLLRTLTGHTGLVRGGVQLGRAPARHRQPGYGSEEERYWILR
jgi:hypothetical protein